jgi:HEPN domain-containing protein
MARKDLQAMRALSDPATADVETFGFHGQQAVGKALKAWLDVRGAVYPVVHDLGR